MAHLRRWLYEGVIAHDRLPLLCFLLGFIVGFLLIRLSVRLIRKQVRWWPGNLRAGDTHVHHMVFGVVLVLLSGIGLVTAYQSGTAMVSVLASIFGLGAALVLDEFALIYYLRDVYWEEQGRTSVDAVFVALAVSGLLLLGFHPLWLLDLGDVRRDRSTDARLLFGGFTLVNLVLAAVVIAKGKIWTGLFGMFFLPLLVVGALRLSRPGAPWARWRYARRPRLMQRAIRRERRYRRPVIRAKIFVQDLIAGKPDVAHVRRATEEELARLVLPAPPAPPHQHWGPARHVSTRHVRRGADSRGTARALRDTRGDGSARPGARGDEPSTRTDPDDRGHESASDGTDLSPRDTTPRGGITPVKSPD